MLRKKFWHLNYILPPSDKGNLTYLPSLAPRVKGAALHHLDTRSWPDRSGTSLIPQAFGAWCPLSTSQNSRGHRKYGQQPKKMLICGWQTSHGARRSIFHHLTQSTGLFVTSCPLLKASRGNTQHPWKHLLKLSILILKCHRKKKE